MAESRHDDQLAKWAREGRVGTEPVAAATVILLRDGNAGIETLMLRKNSKIAFGGMWVFPGGRVDPEDREGLAPGDELAAGRVAAVREAEEEAGLRLDRTMLVPLSHWTPPPITPKRYLTWFFAAAAPSGQVKIDDGEIREHAWMSPAEALVRRDKADIELAPPTWVSLYELSNWPTVEAALHGIGKREPEYFATHITVRDGGPIALWHGDAGWNDSDAEIEGPRHRLDMSGSSWRYERTNERGSDES